APALAAHFRPHTSVVGRPRKTSNAGLRSYATASATTPCSPMVMVVTPVSPSRGASRKNVSWPQLRGRSVDPWRKKPRSQAVHRPTLANLVRTLSKYSEMDQRENCPTCGSSKQYPGAIAEEILLRLFSAQPSRYRSSKSLRSSASRLRLGRNHSTRLPAVTGVTLPCISIWPPRD